MFEIKPDDVIADCSNHLCDPWIRDSADSRNANQSSATQYLQYSTRSQRASSHTQSRTFFRRIQRDLCHASCGSGLTTSTSNALDRRVAMVSSSRAPRHTLVLSRLRNMLKPDRALAVIAPKGVAMKHALRTITGLAVLAAVGAQADLRRHRWHLASSHARSPFEEQVTSRC